MVDGLAPELTGYIPRNTSRGFFYYSLSRTDLASQSAFTAGATWLDSTATAWESSDKCPVRVLIREHK